MIAGFEALFGAGGGSSALAGLIAGDLSVGSFVDLAGTGPVDHRDARDPALRAAVLRAGRAGPRDEARQPALPRRRQLLLDRDCRSSASASRPPRPTAASTRAWRASSTSRAARNSAAAGAAPRAPTAAASRSRSCRRWTSRAWTSREFYAEIAPTLPEPRRPAAARPAEGQQLLRPMTFITAISVRPRRRHALAAVLLGALLAMPGQAQTTQRIPVIRDQAAAGARRRARRGARRAHRSRRRLHAPQFDATTPIEIDVRDAARPAPARLRRLEVTTRQRDVLEQGKRADQELR